MKNLSQKIDAFHASKNHSKIEAAIFENSLDCLWYGYGFSYVNIYGYDIEKAREIFKQAKDFLARN